MCERRTPIKMASTSAPRRIQARRLGRSVGTGIVLAVCALGGTAAVVDGQNRAARLDAYLRGELGLDRRDMIRLGSGRVVAQLLPLSDDRELAVVGVVRTEATTTDVMRATRDFSQFMRGESVPTSGSVGVPPSLTDFRALHLPRDDTRSVRFCTPGDCLVKLPAPTMARMSDLDWSGALPQANVDRLLREMLAEQARRFREDRPLLTMADKSPPTNTVAALGSLVHRSPHALRFVPLLRRALANPSELLPNSATEQMYWSLEDFGLKPVVTLNRTIVYQPERSGLPDVLIATGQLYASHYFETGLGLLSFFDGADNGESTLIYIRHLRFDGDLNAVQRSLLESRVADYVHDLVEEQAEDLVRR